MKNSTKFLLVSITIFAIVASYLTFFNSNHEPENAPAAATQSKPASPPPVFVHTVEAKRIKLNPFSEIPGSVVGTKDSLIAAEISGKVLSIAEVGAKVKKGKVVALIDAEDAKLSHATALLELEKLDTLAKHRQKQYERYLGLGTEAGESQLSIENIKYSRDEAKLDLENARIKLDTAKLNLRRTRIIAPFSGYVVEQNTQVGEYLSPGSGVIRLVDTQNLEVTAQVPSPLLGNIKVGDTISVISSDNDINVQIRAIIPVGDNVSRTMEIRVALANSNWNIGDPVQLRLPQSANREVVAAPRDTIILQSGRTFVFVVDENMKARKVDVNVGIADGNLIELLGNVNSGDKLVFRGGERLSEGQKVTISKDTN